MIFPGSYARLPAGACVCPYALGTLAAMGHGPYGAAPHPEKVLRAGAEDRGHPRL